MKKKLLFALSCLLINACLSAQTLITSVEAETGVLTGVNIMAQTSNSSGPFVTGFDMDGDKVTVNITVPAAGIYKAGIIYRGIYGAKVQDLYANGVFVANVNFPQTTNFVELAAGSVFLNAGINTLTVQKNWGYMDVDKFIIYSVPPNVFNITNTLIDPQATTATKNLYAFMLSQFGKRIITGQTDGYYDQLKLIAGKSPLLRAWDMASYSPRYAYNWANGAHAFGAVDNQDAEKAIAWYNSTGNKGIVNFHWHWHSPSGGTAGLNTFYTQYTVFDVSRGVTAGTQENTDILRDIDAIAVPLKKLRDAGVPVLWRPLHEAGGAWFWWGAKGSTACKALWTIMYDRLTNFHGLHNLIWEWSSPEQDWYPGNTKVDMIGYDSYPGNFNYTTQKNVFDNLYTITAGQKIIAMSENGPIPDIQRCFDSDATWSYFMSWNDLVASQNSNQHIIDVYASPKVITLENYALVVLPVTLTKFTARVEGNKTRIDWVTESEQNNDYFEIERSSDGIHFYKLAMVRGNGTTNSPHNYAVYDNSPSRGINYYRLIQYNVDGKSTVYGVKTVSFNLNVAPSVKVYPNPSKAGLGILLNNYEGKNITVNITDMQGKSVHPQVVSTTGGNGYYKIDVNRKLSPGLYILHINGQAISESLKLIIE
ncbi:MAG: T9SS type A sorting domain-containing protein [Ferruginibacter sp.]|nr:T9SS type A sorting domain-containing protein [Ferruginibacter sp.]